MKIFEGFFNRRSSPDKQVTSNMAMAKAGVNAAVLDSLLYNVRDDEEYSTLAVVLMGNSYYLAYVNVDMSEGPVCSINVAKINGNGLYGDCDDQ